MKMKIIIVLSILLFGIFESNSFALIKSRVQGTVVDMAGQPIKDVKVFLFSYWGIEESINEEGSDITDEKGFFKINNVNSGKYFVSCSKAGYATVNPLSFTSMPRPEDYIQFFELKEGQVKYLKIQMKNGINFKCEIKKKDESGISGFKEITGEVYLKTKLIVRDAPYLLEISKFTTDENGNCNLEGFDPMEKYFIGINNPDGFPNFGYRELMDQNGILQFTYTFDYTKNRITGDISIKDEILLRNARSIELSLVDEASKSEISAVSVFPGHFQYYFFNIEPGKYEIHAYIIYENEEGRIVYKKFPDTLVHVENNSTIVKDLFF